MKVSLNLGTTQCGVNVLGEKEKEKKKRWVQKEKEREHVWRVMEKYWWGLECTYTYMRTRRKCTKAHFESKQNPLTQWAHSSHSQEPFPT